eukprot:8098923-Karenia_brevis.AAC.1
MEIEPPEYPRNVTVDFHGYEATVTASLEQRLSLAEGEVGFATFIPKAGPLDIRHFLDKGQEYRLRPVKSQ